MQMELLAPAGNYTKLETALKFGADAVYVGGKNFSLRSFSQNFDNAELEKAVELVHSMHKKIYVAVNIFVKNQDLNSLEQYLIFLEKIKVDAVIVTDPGLVYLCRKVAKNLCIHLSTQANTLNYLAVNFWAEQGVKRIILARELSLEEISEIRTKIPSEIELEVFVHGAMCISYSGRCLLSNYLNGRDSNNGECVQACRWEYEIKEKHNGKNGLEIIEDERGTYILNSKDLNMIEHLDKIKEAGVISFKIEGRMKSEYYLATVVNAYRRAIDLLENSKTYNCPSYLKEELLKTAHRDFTTSYYLSKYENTVNLIDSSAYTDYIFIANVLSYDDEQKAVYLEMRNRFCKGDILEVLSDGENFNKQIVVEKVINEQGEEKEDLKIVQEKLYLFTHLKLERGDILRKKNK